MTPTTRSFKSRGVDELGSVFLGEGGIDAVEAEIDGAAEVSEGLGIIATEPLAASDAPGAVADFTDFDAGAAEFT